MGVFFVGLMCLVGSCLCMRCPAVVCGVACLPTVDQSSPLSLLHSPFSPRPCGQALERQKEYFDCIRNERDELRDELADIKGKAKAGEVGLKSQQAVPGHRSELLSQICFLCFSFWLELSQLMP